MTLPQQQCVLCAQQNWLAEPQSQPYTFTVVVDRHHTCLLPERPLVHNHVCADPQRQASEPVQRNVQPCAGNWRRRLAHLARNGGQQTTKGWSKERTR